MIDVIGGYDFAAVYFQLKSLGETLQVYNRALAQ